MAEPAKKDETAGADVAHDAKKHPDKKDHKAAPAVAEPTSLPRPGDTPLVAKTDRKFLGTIRSFNAEYARTTYCPPIEDGVTVEEITDPSFWANVAAELKPSDIIVCELWGEDPRWVELLVHATGALWAKVKVLRNVSLADEAQAALGLRLKDAENDHVVVYRGGQKWCVQRKKDKAILSQGNSSQSEAETWLDEYKKSLRK